MHHSNSTAAVRPPPAESMSPASPRPPPRALHGSDAPPAPREVSAPSCPRPPPPPTRSGSRRCRRPPTPRPPSSPTTRRRTTRRPTTPRPPRETSRPATGSRPPPPPPPPAGSQPRRERNGQPAHARASAAPDRPPTRPSPPLRRCPAALAATPPRRSDGSASRRSGEPLARSNTDSISNRGEYLSAFYFAEHPAAAPNKGVFATWANRESVQDPRPTPRQSARTPRSTYLDEKYPRLLRRAGQGRRAG
ncbi:hypothetical protein SMICM304S_07266 [Streptomyces microflavus]